MNTDQSLPVTSPEVPDHEAFMDADEAIKRLCELYETATRFLCDHFARVLSEGGPTSRYRAF